MAPNPTLTGLRNLIIGVALGGTVISVTANWFTRTSDNVRWKAQSQFNIAEAKIVLELVQGHSISQKSEDDMTQAVNRLSELTKE
jgi:hypothetical protein